MPRAMRLHDVKTARSQNYTCDGRKMRGALCKVRFLESEKRVLLGAEAESVDLVLCNIVPFVLITRAEKVLETSCRCVSVRDFCVLKIAYFLIMLPSLKDLSRINPRFWRRPCMVGCTVCVGDACWHDCSTCTFVLREDLRPCLDTAD